MAVHFKFRSAVDFDSVDVDGNGITVANLKHRIVEQKNLGKSSNFDLVITNAESGEEYSENNFLVPKNTSVIIKRVPAKRAKTTLLVHELEDEHMEQQQFRSDKDSDVAHLALTSTMDELYDMDDFGVDLYAVDESALTHVQADEMSNASVLLAKSATEGKRLTQSECIGRSLAKGVVYSRAIPPPGYVCHRCGQLGHFIQHCPTNGDPAFDWKRAPRARAADCEDSTILPAGVTQPINFFTKEVDPLPPELRCSLCQGIFKEAAMIPCCQYSFCDTCIRQYLLEKGLCPQCGSEKIKNGDLLPNVALRQAIDRFTNAQLDTAVPPDGADLESAAKAAKMSSPVPLLRKPSFTAKDLTSTAVADNQPDLLAVDDSVCESAIGSKEKNTCEGSKFGAQAGDNLFLGKKKKKPSDGVTEHHVMGKPRKVNRFCFVCGSPEHIARNCPGHGVDNSMSFPPQRSMFHPVGPVPPRAIAPFGQEMYWPGQPVVHVRPLPLNYGEGMYAPMPYGAPALPVAPYGVSSYPPPIYPNPQVHGYLGAMAPRMMAPRERPLSREEFMELQERERRRRLTQERQEREPSEEKVQSIGAGDGQSLSSDSGPSLHTQLHSGNKPQGTWRRDFDSSYPKETARSKSKQKHNRKLLVERPDERTVSRHFDTESDDDSDFESRGLRLYSLMKQPKMKPISSVTRRNSNRSAFDRISSDREDGQNARMRSFKEEGIFKGSKQTSLGRFDALSFEKHEHGSYEHTGYVKHDGTRVSDAGAAEMLHSSRHRTKRNAFEGRKVIYSEHHVKSVAEMERNDHLAFSDDGGSVAVLEKKHSGRKHHTKPRSETMENTSGDELRKKKKHKKRKLEGLKDLSTVEANVSESLSHKKHKSSHAVADKHSTKSFYSSELSLMEDDIEVSRWQMEDGLSEEDPQRQRSKRKRHRSSKSTL